ncbi:MAG: RagB/SusD family nutrient uptake outer membrane protein [Bacteroides sp.]|nr:RagB/SusD family nutrient uptake outer membrane protein [Bacteroides sp.]
MKQYKLSAFLFGVVAMIAIAGCSIDPVYYTETVPDTFFETQQNVWQRFYRPFTHWRNYIAGGRYRYETMELGTDEICMPRRGEDFSDVDYEKRHIHDFSSGTRRLDNAWEKITQGIAHAWDALEDIDANVDFEKMGFPEGTRESMLAQLRTLVAFYYLEGLDLWGGMPLYSTVNTPVVGRSTDKETFDFIEELLDLAIPDLPVKESLHELATGSLTQAAGAALKVRLYFNAESYINKEMYSEAAAICENIIAGKYGEYEIAEDWKEPFGFTNNRSGENIWSVPSDNVYLQGYEAVVRAIMHYNSRDYLKNNDAGEGYNGICLTPSLDPEGNPYTYKLGSPFAKFEDTDIRKKPYYYKGDGDYEGMFLYGLQINPGDLADPTIADEDKAATRGTKEYAGQILEFRDQIARFSEVTPDNPVENLVSDMKSGEENSGVRLMKISPMPTLADNDKKYDPYIPVIRLAEIYYTLAECEFRAGNTEKAAQWINAVRKRYFPDGDPNPVTAANLDQWRLLDEWLIEFIGENRRRTDLIRWDVYVNEDWWAHTASKEPHKNRYPLHSNSLNSNNLLEQNPGYGGN